MISVSNLGMRFGDNILFKNAHFQLNPGNHYGLVGANGSGKSTLIKILIQELVAEAGEISIPSQVKVGSLKQSHFLYDECRIRDVVIMGKAKLWQAMLEKEKLLQQSQFSDNECETLATLEKAIEIEAGYAAASDAAKLLEGLGIQEKVHLEPMSILSGGYKLRVLLAQVLFSSPDILILDEPTNHLDIFSIRWLESYLKEYAGTLLLSSHDREFLDAISDYILDLDYGTFKLYTGNYTQFLQTKGADRDQKEHLLASQNKRKESLQVFVDRFRAKSSKASQAKSKMRLIEKIEGEIDTIDLSPSSRCYPNVSFNICRPSGAIPLTVKEISKSYGSKTVLNKISLSVERRDRVAFLGANGIGKSTLFEILTGACSADEGQFEWGFATYFAYFPQDHAREVKGNLTLLDWLSQFDRNASQEYLRGILGQVLFSGDDVDKSIEVLSGGETARLILAKMMLLKHNVLIFDEPTNHLDMEATEALLEALENYTGTILLISHNRYFVSRIATRIIELTHNGIHDFKGNYSDYIAWREAILLAEANPSQKIKSATPAKTQYAEQKQRQRYYEQLQRKVIRLEESCHQLEGELKKFETLFCTEGFYQKTSIEEQSRYLHEKNVVEQKLQQAFEEWEKASIEINSLQE